MKMPRRRQILLLTAGLLIAWNVGLIIFRDQPPKPEVFTDSVPTQGGLVLETGHTSKDLPLVELSPTGQWLLNGNEIDQLKKLVHLTVPNVDSPDYQLWVKTSNEATFDNFIRIVRSLCRAKIQHFLLFDDRLDANRDEKGLSLTLDRIWDQDIDAYVDCETDPDIAERYKIETQEYENSSADLIR
tara:strand:- start:1409 stop:1966 length:558 start_codon:yes stop_codon:yes gene_type:complete